MLSKSNLFSIAAVLLLGTGSPAFANKGSFDIEVKQAEENLNTAGGARYDQELESYFESQEGIYPALELCLKSFFEDHSIFPKVHGYFRFSSDGSYQLVLQPEGALAKCFSVAYAGYSPPPPPEFPYFSQYSYEMGP